MPAKVHPIAPGEARIRLSRSLVLDYTSDLVKQDGLRGWIGGEPGAGKSTAAALIVSQLVQQQQQVVVLDPHAEYGELWGLNPGRICRIGYGDEPVSENSVQWCLNEVHCGMSVLIDLSHWALRAPARDQFVGDFIEGLYELRVKSPKQTLLVAEEAKYYAPQAQMSGQYENVLRFVEFATAGRKFGLNALYTTQRQSLVDINVLANCNMRMFLRTCEFADWKRIRPYIPWVDPEVPSDKPRRMVEFADIKRFESGEAIVVSRWWPDSRVHLNMPPVAVGRKL